MSRLSTFFRSLFYSKQVHLWFSESYRLPILGLQNSHHFDLRRAEHVLTFGFDKRLIRKEHVHMPRKIGYRELSMVHDCSYLESLSKPETLAKIMAVEPRDFILKELTQSFREATFATVQAAKQALEENSTHLNLLGGFHHASPTKGSGFCPINDIAIAVRSLQQDGFRGKIAILDFDAHPPDGICDCIGGDEQVWIGSVSGCDWGTLEHCNETKLLHEEGDVPYLAAVAKTLEQMPDADLTFVIAGGDPLEEDFFGGLSCSLSALQQRDWMVAQQIGNCASVWLPGGGYSKQAWKVLAGTLQVLVKQKVKAISKRYNPLQSRLQHIAQKLDMKKLGQSEDLLFTDDDLYEIFGGFPPSRTKRLLNYYTTEGIEYALFEYGLLEHMKKLGYDHFHIELDKTHAGLDRMRVTGDFASETHLLCEFVVEKQLIDGNMYLYVHWLTLRNPRSQFGKQMPQLPGQEVPGLGMSKEVGELLHIMAKRLELKGVALQTAWYHIAFALRRSFHFLDPVCQGHFEALQRDLHDLDLLEQTKLIAEKKIQNNGQIYEWEAGIMVSNATNPWTKEEQAQKNRILQESNFQLIDEKLPC